MNQADTGRGLDRRDFLKLSAGSLAAFTVLGGALQLSGCSRRNAPAAAGYQWLGAEDLPLFSLLIAVSAGPALPGDAAAQGVIGEGLRRIDLACAALGGPAQQQLRQLLDLLHWAPFRRLAGGVTRSWPEASAADLTAMLQRFGDSRLSLLNAAMRVLAKLGALAFWGQSSGYAAARYPGPPAWAFNALNS